ncbi:MAG: hypothetical protein DCC59_13560 [Chloroflexi bacterium]|nr:MAG: hypothetical protein DCC59_13560 [Chloroflexota bacterium]
MTEPAARRSFPCGRIPPTWRHIARPRSFLRRDSPPSRYIRACASPPPVPTCADSISILQQTRYGMSKRSRSPPPVKTDWRTPPESCYNSNSFVGFESEPGIIARSSFQRQVIMIRNLLLVDDQRDILRLLHSTLDTLKNKDIQVFEAQSGEEALLESSRRNIDMLVSDYKLPGMTGVELMHKVRARHAEVKVIFITGMTERKMRDEMLNSGAFAIFDKPIPIADFLDSVERGLGLVQTIFPPEIAASGAGDEPQQARLSDLLANFRQDFNADAVFLLNERGLINARTGSLHDPSMEVSLISTLMAIHSTSLKVAKHNHQESIESYHVFNGGDHDLLFLPVTPLYALLVAGKGLADEDQILDSVRGLISLRAQVVKALASMGVTGELKFKSQPAAAPPAPTVPRKNTDRLAKAIPAPEMEALLKDAADEKAKKTSADDFWDEAAQDLGRKSLNPEVISLEEAKKMGLIPGGDK